MAAPTATTDAAREHADEELPPGLVRALRGDPDHAPELLMRYAVRRLADDAAAWSERALAAHPEQGPGRIANQISERATWSSRAAGAISGTPFLFALVPAYVSVLWDQAWMTLRIAALHGHDVRAPGTTAELLVLRGVHPTIAEAQAALDALDHRPEHRFVGGYRSWWQLGRRVMVLAGFLDPDDGGPPPGPLRRALLWTLAAGIYALTWILPLSFMIVMAQSCSLSTRRMAQAALARYAPAGTAPAEAPVRRRRGRTVVLAALGGGIPIAAVAWANNLTQANAATWVRSVGVLFGLSLVLALYALSRRPAR